MLENLNLGTETLVLLGLGAGGFMFGPKKGGMAGLAKMASIGLLGLGVGNATGIFTVSKLKGMLGLNGTAGAFQTTYYNPYTGSYQYTSPSSVYIQTGGSSLGWSSNQQQQYDPYLYQYQQQYQPYSYSNYYPQYYPTGQQQYYYPYQQQYQSYPYQYPTYQQYQQQTYSPLSTCMQTCQQMYQY